MRNPKVLGMVVGLLVLVGAGPSSRPVVEPRNDLAGLTNFAEVSEGLYRGAQPTAEGFAQLKKMGVKTVVSLRSTHDDRELMKGTGLKYLRIPAKAWHMEDEDVVRFLKVVGEAENRPVFVHCQQGSDRTGCAVAAYRIVEQGWTVEEAAAELPRFGYHPVWVQIQHYLKHFDVEEMRKKVGEAKKVEVEEVK